MDNYDLAQQSIQNLADNSIFYNNPLSAVGGGKEKYGTLEALNFARMNNEFNSAEAQKQRDFEERMSSTAYSRAAKDLESLGFSPVSLFGNANAASTPSGVAATSSGGPGNKSNSGGSLLLDMVKTIGLLVLGGAKLGAQQKIAQDKLDSAAVLQGSKNATKLKATRILKGLEK